MNWIIIGILVVLVFLFLKFREIRHKLSFIVILFLLLFLGLTFWNVYSANELNLSTFDGMVGAGKVYFSWLGGLFSNTKAITSFAVKQDWGLKNETSPPVKK